MTWTTEGKRGERALRRAIQSDLAAWARHALQPQGLAPARHHLVLTDALADVAAGRTDRLMVLMPPGSAKSTYASLLFPPWFLSRHPRAHVIAASHTAGLAEGFGRGVRGLILEHGPRLGLRLDPSSRAAGRFAVGRIGVADALLPGPAVRAWDLAAAEGGGDWTAGVRLAAGDSAWQVQDVVRLQGGPEAVVAAIRCAAEQDGPGRASPSACRRTLARPGDHKLDTSRRGWRAGAWSAARKQGRRRCAPCRWRARPMPAT